MAVWSILSDAGCVLSVVSLGISMLSWMQNVTWLSESGFTLRNLPGIVWFMVCISINYQDGLLGLKGPLIYPYLGPSMELQGLSGRPGRDPSLCIPFGEG